MKKLLMAVVIIGLLVCGAQAVSRQDKAHEIAELAREMGEPEDSPIIAEAQRIWWECENPHQRSDDFTAEEIHHMANVIYYEAGNGCTEEHQLLVGAVVMNRVDDERFPNTIDEVINQPLQYNRNYTNGVLEVPTDRVDEFEALAIRAINGEPCDCIDEVVWQAQFRQGNGIYKTCDCYLNGKYFSTTYFCY